jgi:hypothetical protein
LGAVLVETGDTEEYSRLCKKLVEQFPNKLDSSRQLAKQCLLYPATCTNLAIFSALLDSETADLNRSASTTLALLHYRKGDFQEAVEESQHVLKVPTLPGRAVQMHALIAMSEASLGHVDAAWTAFDAAMAQAKTDRLVGNSRDLGPDFAEYLFSKAIFREAEATLNEKLGGRQRVAQ